MKRGTGEITQQRTNRLLLVATLLLLQRIAHVFRCEYRQVRGDARGDAQAHELLLIKRQHLLDRYTEFIGKTLNISEILCGNFIAVMLQIVRSHIVSDRR